MPLMLCTCRKMSLRVSLLQKTIGKQELSDLHEFMVETQNQLEMCLPLAFFDIMPHLMIHMVYQIQALSPCYLHEIWSYEQFMSVLSRYVHNRAYLEGSMIEDYSTERSRRVLSRVPKSIERD